MVEDEIHYKLYTQPERRSLKFNILMMYHKAGLLSVRTICLAICFLIYLKNYFFLFVIY